MFLLHLLRIFSVPFQVITGFFAYKQDSLLLNRLTIIPHDLAEKNWLREREREALTFCENRLEFKLTILTVETKFDRKVRLNRYIMPNSMYSEHHPTPSHSPYTPTLPSH